MITKRVARVLILVLSLSLPILAIPSDNGGKGSTGTGGNIGGGSVGGSIGNHAGAGRNGSTRDSSSHSPSASSQFVPSLVGTSFASVNTYYMWQDFYSYLQTRYWLDPFYFNRFFVNSEPLVTPFLMKVAMREPLKMSMEMASLADELEALVQSQQAGQPMDKQGIAAKAQRIRELAKKLRHDQSLGFVDQRKEQDLLKGSNDTLGSEAVSRLQQMVTDLNTQLKAMYEETSTSTVSVNTLTQPSFGSILKGIERLSKSVENFAY